MTLLNVIEIWEMQHQNKGFFDDCVINTPLVVREDLFNYLLLEYGGMIPVDNDSTCFHLRVVNFFKIHDWNIRKLAESTNFDYDPLENYRVHGKLDRDTNRDITKDDDSDTKGRLWQQDVNLVSAYNDNKSPQSAGVDEDGNPKYTYIDTEHHRDITNKNYNEHNDFHADDNDHAVVDETTLKHGNTGNTTYQEMIEEERKQAQFNIYKWIARHFCTELLISVW